MGKDINDNIFTDFLEGDDKYKNDRLINSSYYLYRFKNIKYGL